MLFNGHTAESLKQITDEQFYEIAILFADGQLGAKTVFDALEPITSAVWNYMAMGKKRYTADDFYPVQRLYFPKAKPDVSQQLIALAMSNAMKGS